MGFDRRPVSQSFSRDLILQKNVDEAVEKLKAKGIEVLGIACHVANAQQRKNLIEKTVQVSGRWRMNHFP